MKARVNKQGEWTISQVTMEEIAALEMVLEFAHNAEKNYCHDVEKEREAIDELREEDRVLYHADTWRTFMNFIIETSK